MFTEFDERMMLLALEEARLSLEAGDIPVGAVIVRGEEVIARAGNTRERLHDPSGHAEINALRAAAELLGTWRLPGCTMYVTLEPCCMCAGAIVQSRLDRVVFGAYDAQAGACGSLYRITEDPAMNHFTRADGGFMEEECAALIRQSLRK